MQQRRLRLGDTVDDYCPRERRLTNHVVAAMIDDQITHTRCTACDADHEYKQARMPTLRRKRVEGEPASAPVAPGRIVAPPSADFPDDEVALDVSAGDEVIVEVPEGVEAVAIEVAAEDEPARHEDEGPVHRRLIRAAFPRPEGQPPEWKEPEFTIRQPTGPSRGRFGRGGGGQSEPNGNRAGHSRRGAGPGGGGFQRHSGGGPPRDGNRPGGGRPGGHGGGQGQAPVGPGGQRRRRRGR